MSTPTAPLDPFRTPVMVLKSSPAHVFDTQADASHAIRTLGNSGVDVEHLSLLGSRGPAVVEVGGMAVLYSALAGLGIAQAQASAFEAALVSGKFVLMVRGDAQEQARAAAVLANQAPTGLDIAAD